MKIKKKLLGLIILLLISCSDLTAKTIKILFIGNSYTYAGGNETDPGLPRHLKEMAIFYNKDIQYDFVVKGGAMLEKHWKEGKALELIQNEKYDYVVLQDQSTATMRRLDSFREYSAKFDEAIKKQVLKQFFMPHGEWLIVQMLPIPLFMNIIV